MRTSDSTSDISKALTKAQEKMGFALKDSTNPFFKSKYADLESCILAAKQHLTDNGLSVSQGNDYRFEQWVLVTRLSHESGQFIETLCPIIANKQDAQGFGSGMTYARRYAYAAIIGLTQSDDDGALAVESTQKEKPTNFAPQTGEPGDYVIQIGKKFNGKTLKEVPEKELVSFVKWLKDEAKNQGKELDQRAQNFVAAVDRHLKAGE